MSDTLTLLIWLAKATALLMLAMGLTVGLRRAPAGARHLVWLATLVALLLVPAVSVWAPLPVALIPAPAAQASLDVQGPASNVERAPVDGPRQAPGVRRAGLEAPAVSDARRSVLDVIKNLPTSTILLGGYGAVVVVLLAWLALGALSVRRIMRGARTLTDEAWLNPLYETADRLDLDRVPRLVMSSAIEMPFACSLLHPTIVLPASAHAWSDERRRVVLFHELAHIRRRDLVGHTLGRLACAFYWFHPLVWSAAKQLRAESERACDDLVLSCGARASDYANHLLDIVTGVRRFGAPATALPMANRREFEGRMLAILDPAVRRATPSRAQKFLLVAGLGSVALTIAAVAPQQRAAVAGERTVQADTNPPAIEASRDDRAQIYTDRTTSTSSRTTTRSSARTSSETSKKTWPADSDPSAALSKTLTTIITSLGSEVTAALGPQSQGAGADTALLGRLLRTDRSAEVRRTAAWALQGRRDGVPLLIERLRVDESADVRETAAWALAGLPSADALAALSAALRQDKSSEVRGTAAWGLGHMPGADAGALVAALDDAGDEVRQKALWALASQQLDRAPAKVIALLKDPDHDVRLMSAWLLTEISDKSAIPALREAFMNETNSDAMQAEFRALLFMGDRSQELIDRALASPNGDIRAKAVRMIAGQGPGVWPWPWPWPDPRPHP